MSISLILAIAGCFGGSESSDGLQQGAEAASSLNLSASPSPVPPSGQVTLTATVTDSQGNAVEGESVRFSVVTNNSGGSLESSSQSTDAQGQVSVTYNAGGDEGTDEFQARASSESGVSQSVAVEVGRAVASLGIASDRARVPSDGGESATITASALDQNNAAIEGVPIAFSATAGRLSAAESTTDASGQAQVSFSSAPSSPSNKVATITATRGEQSEQIPIRIDGTTVTVNPRNTELSADGSSPAETALLLKDSASTPIQGKPICYEVDSTGGGDLSVEDTSGNSLTETCPLDGVSGQLAGTTDTDGEVTVQVVGASAGEAVLRVTGSGATAGQTFQVSPSSDVFKITSPSDDPTPVFEIGGAGATVEIAGTDAPEVKFVTSVGQWASSGDTTVSKTVSGGTASADLNSDVAGIADIFVEETGPSDPASDAAQIAFTAPLADAANLTLQADPRVVPVSGGGAEFTSELVATLETSDGAPVARAPVSFELVTTTGGGETVSPPSVQTGLNGKAVTTLTSGSKASNTEGIELKASVSTPTQTLTDTFELVITDEPGSVVIGQASEVRSNADETAYILPMSVLVSDTNGNPVANAEVTLSNWPIFYSTGFWADAGGEIVPFITGTFPNEDVNENNTLDPGEDANGDGDINPKNSAAGNLPRTVTTNESGVANFELTYLKQFAAWTNVRIRASTLVGGDQIVSQTIETLPFAEGEEDNLPDSPFNDECAFTASLKDPDNTTITLNGDPTMGEVSKDITLELSQLAGATASLVDRGVQARVENENFFDFVDVPEGVTDAAGEFDATIEKVSTGDGTATVTYYVSCATTSITVNY